MQNTIVADTRHVNTQCRRIGICMCIRRLAKALYCGTDVGSFLMLSYVDDRIESKRTLTGLGLESSQVSFYPGVF